MAAQNYAQLQNALGIHYHPKVVRTINRAAVLLSLLRVVPAQSHQVHGVAEFGSGSASVVADNAAAPAANADLPVAYNLPFGIYTDRISIGGLAQAVAQVMKNPADLSSPFARQLMNCVGRVASKMNVDLYTGVATSPQSLTGLVGTAGAAMSTGVYAGIDRGVKTDWAAISNLNGGTPRALSFALIRATLDSIYNASGSVPDLAVMPAAQWTAFSALFDTLRKWEQATTAGAQRATLVGGNQAAYWDNTLFVKDKDCPSGQIIFLNREHVEIEAVPMTPDPMQDSMGQLVIKGTPESQLGEGGSALQLLIKKLGPTGWGNDSQVVTAAQLINRVPNTSGVLGDLS